MKPPIYLRALLLVFCLGFFILQCSDKKGAQKEETVVTGKATILTDESLMPIIEDVALVFESEYNADLVLKAKSENEIVNDLMNGNEEVAILSRPLSNEEISIFKNKNLFPRVTPFATDGIAIIGNREANDSLLAVDELLRFLKGERGRMIRGIVVDNPNSGAVRQLLALAQIKSLPESGVFSFSNNKEAIEYVANNSGMVGIVGLNWITQPTSDIEEKIGSIKVFKLKGEDGLYYSPTQNNLAEGKYPLARHLYVVNCQGFQGLGVGFASFVAGERGQRIILKSGLLPVRLPGRKIVTRSGIIKNNN